MNKPNTTPLAYGYVEGGKLYTSFRWKLVEADYFNTIGKDLVNFAYCDRVMDGADKPCSEIGAYITDVKKVASDPVLSAYRKAYQRLHKRVELGYMEDNEFARWKVEAARKRDRCMTGELDAEEFLAWVDATSRRR